jgi:alkyl hydroperoxide reductase subunit AhpC
MRFTVGGSVPPIQLPAYVKGRRQARLVGPGNERGRWVVLAFYPRDFDSDCASELAALAELAPAYAEENAAIMAVSGANWLSHRRWFAHHPQLSAVDYPVLADTGRELARAFDALEADGTYRRATFLIDPEGVVRHATAGGGRTQRSAVETLAVLRAMRSTPVLLAA